MGRSIGGWCDQTLDPTAAQREREREREREKQHAAEGKEKEIDTVHKNFSNIFKKGLLLLAKSLAKSLLQKC